METDILPALALGAESPELGVMNRPPRSRHERLLDLPTLLRAYAWLGTIEAILSLGGFFFAYWLAGWRIGVPKEQFQSIYVVATTMSLAGIVACQLGNGIVCRSRLSIHSLGLFGNRRLLWVGIKTAFQLGGKTPHQFQHALQPVVSEFVKYACGMCESALLVMSRLCSIVGFYVPGGDIDFADLWHATCNPPVL